MDINVGDKLVITNQSWFYPLLKMGEVGQVTELSESWVTVNFHSCIQNIPREFIDSYLTKVDMVVRERYKDPQYIKEVKVRLKELELSHNFNKIYYRLGNVNQLRNNSIEYISRYRESIKELNYIYTILRQHNEMKRMYARLR